MRWSTARIGRFGFRQRGWLETVVEIIMREEKAIRKERWSPVFLYVHYEMSVEFRLKYRSGIQEPLSQEIQMEMCEHPFISPRLTFRIATFPISICPVVTPCCKSVLVWGQRPGWALALG